MLSYVGNAWEWCKQVQVVCKLYSNNDIVCFSEDAEKWAKAQGNYLERDYLGAYRSSLEKKGEPLIPHHWRTYTAHMLGLTVSSKEIRCLNEDDDDSVTTPSAAVIIKAKLKPQYYRASGRMR
jgi:hypothetical protein